MSVLILISYHVMPGLDKEGILERTNGPIKDIDIDDGTFEINLVNSNQMDTTMVNTI